ncbi:hypothetical protein ACGFMO_05260 [Streptomyces niveus]|uniref:hypothetical protein n=1 Tax=Streptomyces niveus TaxID=193462 RepID=UPI0037131F72
MNTVVRRVARLGVGLVIGSGTAVFELLFSLLVGVALLLARAARGHATGDGLCAKTG